MKNHHGFGMTIVELLVGLTCLTMLAATTSIVFAADGHGMKTHSQSLRDATHLSQLHKAFIIYSREFNDIFPRPGLIDRLPTQIGGQLLEIPGRGEEDITANTTARLYSAMIMQNYFTPEVCVSPIERNPVVQVREQFGYNKYDPAKDVYWDDTFHADLEKQSNTSYAHLVMFGKRMDREWRSSFNARSVALGNRGPLAGERDMNSFTCGPHGYWAGNVVFNDNHVELLRTMTPPDMLYASQDDEGETTRSPDNIFAMETGPSGADMILSFTKVMTADGPVLQHD